jgi:hypothetical protein
LAEGEFEIEDRKKTKSEGSHDEERQYITVAIACTIKYCVVVVQADW